MSFQIHASPAMPGTAFQCQCKVPFVCDLLLHLSLFPPFHNLKWYGLHKDFSMPCEWQRPYCLGQGCVTAALPHPAFRLPKCFMWKKEFDFCLNECLLVISFCSFWSDQFSVYCSCFSLLDSFFCCLFMALAVMLFFHVFTDKDLKWKGLSCEGKIFLEVKVPSI